jgi:hypothetical protein
MTTSSETWGFLLLVRKSLLHLQQNGFFFKKNNKFMFPMPPRRDAAPVRRYEPFWTRVAARRCFLQALIACGEDATVRPPPRCAVAHALANRHFTALHGRAGFPRSCGSLLASMVATVAWDFRRSAARTRLQ